MSGVISAVSAITATQLAAATTVYGIYAGEEQSRKQGEALSQQRQAQADAKTAADKQQQTSEQNTNKANAKQPDVSALLTAAENASKKGTTSTMLTGPMGVNTADLALGKTTLLGS